MGKRLKLGLEIGALLALLALPAMALALNWAHAFSWTGILIMATPPAVSAFGMAIAAILVPDLAGERLRPPMNLTLPIVFAVINLMVTRAVWLAPSAVISPNRALDPIRLWFDPKLILIAFALQVIVVTALCRPWASPEAEPTA